MPQNHTWLLWWVPNTSMWDFPDIIKFCVAVHTTQNHTSLLRRAPNTDFPNVIKFCTWCTRYGRKQSDSGIQTMIRIGLKSWSVRPCPDTCQNAKCHQNPCTHFWVILLTDRQTDKHRGQLPLPPPLSEVNNSLTTATLKANISRNSSPNCKQF